MKILIISQYYNPENVRINEIAKEIVNRGHEVTVLTGLPNYPEGVVPKEYKFFRKRKEIIDGVEVIRSFEIGRRKGFLYRILNYVSFAVSACIKALFMKDEFDKVLVYQLSPITMVWPARIYKKLHKKEVTIYSLDLWPESMKTVGMKETSFIYKIIDKISRKMYNTADKIIVSSHSFIEVLKQRVNDNVEFKYLPQHSEKLDCIEDNVNKEEYNFMFAGNIGKAQSIETIIKAANILKDNNNIKFHILGDGSALEECKKLSNELELTNIIFYGRKPQEEMGKYYSMADAMLVTLIDEEFCNRTMPAKVQSYMSAKKPIIAAINGETRDVILESKSGICVPAEDYNALAKSILAYVN